MSSTTVMPNLATARIGSLVFTRLNTTALVGMRSSRVPEAVQR